MKNLNYVLYNSSFGELIIGEIEEQLALLQFLDCMRVPAALFNFLWVKKSTALLSRTIQQVKEYEDNQRDNFDLPLFEIGTAFQKSVWNTVANVNELKSYAEIAAKLGDIKSTRAVSTAIGQNPRLIVVPCHRIIGSDGNMHGFAGGIDRKVALLTHEKKILV